MNNIFNYDNAFFRGMNKVMDALFASALWLVFCLPVITIGASTTAFYYTVHKSVCGNRGYIWQSFWSSFKSNFKQTTKIWLIQAVMFAFLAADRHIMEVYLEQGSKLGVLYYVFHFLILFWAVWCVYTFTYSARFENGMRDTMKNAAVIAVLNLPWSLLILGLLIGAGFVIYLFPIYLLPIIIVAVPAGLAVLYDTCLEKVFRKYMSEEDLKKENEMNWERHY